MEFQYIRDNLMILPYVPGAVDFKEDTLVGIYHQLKQEGLYETVFHENPKMTLNEFIRFFSSSAASLAFFCVIQDGIEVPAGMCWLTDLVRVDGMFVKGQGSFVFFKEFQKPMYTNALGRIALDFWFNKMELGIVVGITPSNNRAALLYAKRIGFTENGRIPMYTSLHGNICDGVITSMRREDYKENDGQG